MRYGSVCSGIEAATVAWHALGWRAAFYSEIDPFASSVITHHYPETPNLGDFTLIGKEWANIDLLVGGTPCQSFSVAGLRKGMADDRGNLALEFLRLADRLRPRWLVWENVPGVLSSNKGRDFGAFLGGLVQLGYGFAYRVLDAQHFGVPQRRRRVFVVGSAGDWRRAAAVLFERESLSRNPPAGREAGEKVTGCVNSSPGMRGWGNDDEALIANAVMSHSGLHDNCGQNFVTHTLRADGFDASEDGTGRGTPIVPVVFNWQAGGSAAMLGISSEVTTALGCTQTPAIAYQCHGNNIGPMGTLRTGDGGVSGGVPFIVNAAESCAKASHARRSEVARCIDSTGSFANAQGGTVAVQAAAVRRLTPRECERLQGFPTCIDRSIISVCLDNQNNCASVAVQCLRSPSDALPVGVAGNTEPAPSADTVLWNDRESREALVAVHVRSSHEPRLAAVRSHGRWLWSASGAAGQKWSLPPTPPDDFARVIAGLARCLAAEVLPGRAVSPQRSRRFTLPAPGRWLAAMCGQESGGCASGAESARTEVTRFITSDLGQSTPPSDLTVETWLSFALVATSSFIPEGTQPASSFKVVIDHETDWTLVPYRGKPASPGPRYKAVGNSMACPVMRWIGKRIDLIEGACRA